MPTLTSQNATYVAVNLQDILYGIELALYLETVHALLILKEKQRASLSLLLFSTVMLVLITIWISATDIFGEEMWVIHGAQSPGGANTYWLANVTGWYLNLARTAIFVLQLMTDALLIHRCRALWETNLVIIGPLVLWFASLILGVLQTWILSSHVGHFLHSTASHMALSYYTVSVFLNTTLTSLICYRLIRHGKLIRAELGHEFSSVYFAAAEIIVESALPFTASGIVFLITLGLGLQVMIPFSWVYFMMTCISPQMLILRVLGRKNLPQSVDKSTTSDIRFRQWSEVPVAEGQEPDQSWPLSKVHSASPRDADILFTNVKNVSW